MIKVRFEIPFRVTNVTKPKVWYIKWPYWICGQTPFGYVMLAYAENMELFNEQWPHVEIIKIEEVDEIKFSVRFRAPKWYRSWSDFKYVDPEMKGVEQTPILSEQESKAIGRQLLVENGIDT